MSQPHRTVRATSVHPPDPDLDPQRSQPGDYPERGVPFWLPPTGTGNGLRATAWAQILQIPGRSVAQVLSLLAAHDIPGFVDLAVDASGHRVLTGRAGYRLWVDSHQYSRAEDLLMSVSRVPHEAGTRE